MPHFRGHQLTSDPRFGPGGPQIPGQFQGAAPGQIPGAVPQPVPGQVPASFIPQTQNTVTTDSAGNTVIIDSGGQVVGGGIAGGIGTTGQIPGAAATFPPTPANLPAPGQEFIPGSTTNPPAAPGANTGLITDVFSQVLGRAPSAEVIQFYEQQLAQGLSPQEFAGQIANSPEALQRNVAPPTGLIGGEQALQQGLGASIASIEEGFGRAGTAIQQGTGQALDLVGQAQDPLRSFQQTGTQGNELLAAFLGAGGVDAQRQAIENFTLDPSQRFLQEEGERAITRNAAAIGGLGGGNVRRELTRFGVGTAQQALQQRLQNLSGLSGQGLNAAGGIAQLGAQGAGFAQQGGLQQGNLLAQGGTAAAQLFQQAGRDISQQRFQTGQDIANAVSGTTSALSQLANQQGAGLSDIAGGGAANIANLLSGFGQLDAAGQQQLAALLASISVGEGSQIAGIQSQIGAARAEGTIGAAAGFRDGVARLAAAISGVPLDFATPLPPT